MNTRRIEAKRTQAPQLVAGLALVVASGCEPSLDVPQAQVETQREIQVHGAPTDGGTAEVLRFEVPRAEPGSLRLFEGSLSEYYERRIRERDLPDSLLERQVPALTWGALPSVPGTAWLGTAQPLTPGQRYSLAEAGAGLLLEIDVALEQPTYATRIWPIAQRTGRLAVYCAGTSVQPGEVALDGCAAAGSVTAGIGESGLLGGDCFTLALQESSPEPCLAPLAIGDVWLPSTQLGSPDDSEPQAMQCESQERKVGNGCALVGDSYVVFRKPTDQMWVLTFDGRTFGPEVGDSLVIRQLNSQSEYSYSLFSVDHLGTSTLVAGKLATLRATPRVVLNEVLANSNGPEPAQEWIEIFNAGTLVASLEGLVLEDGAGEVELPAAHLQPGEYALLVTPEYDRAYPFDLSPSMDVQLIEVEQLGRGGLSNSGEPLILRGAGGELLSAIPPLKHTRPGYSVARRTPELTDVLTSFQTHGAPGASPGEANHFDEPSD